MRTSFVQKIVGASFFAMVVAATAACTVQSGTPSDDAGPASGQLCTPGATNACTCSDGRSGAQQCNSAGTGYDACACCVAKCDGKSCGDDGCGGSCGSCESGFVCSTAGACDLDPAGTWIVKVTKGHVPDASWNYTSLPDARVCLRVGDLPTKCTSYKDDTVDPIWNEDIISARADQLLVNGINYTLWDGDTPDGDDEICSGKVTLTKAEFVNGGFSETCSGGNTWEAKLLLKE